MCKPQSYDPTLLCSHQSRPVFSSLLRFCYRVLKKMVARKVGCSVCALLRAMPESREAAGTGAG